jgi:uncharacterized membrane protein
VRRFPLCNNRPETAASIGRWRLPICCRCAGLIGGAIAGACALEANAQVPLALAIVLVAPCFLDGLASYSRRGTTNLNRWLTGGAAGFGAFHTLAFIAPEGLALA